MKKVVTTLTILVTLFSFSQTPITKSIGEFTELKAYDLINIELIKSKENKVEIFGDNTHDVVVVNKNGKLKIKMEIDEIFDGNKTNVKLYYTSVDIIDANEGAYIASQDNFDQYELTLKAQEGGYIKLNCKLKNTEIKAVTGGVIELSGTTNTQDININTGGIFKGKDFESKNTQISIRAGGEADVNTSGVLDIKIRAGGDVFIYGDPETVNESRALGGRIKRMN